MTLPPDVMDLTAPKRNLTPIAYVALGFMMFLAVCLNTYWVGRLFPGYFQAFSPYAADREHISSEFEAIRLKMEVFDAEQRTTDAKIAAVFRASPTAQQLAKHTDELHIFIVKSEAWNASVSSDLKNLKEQITFVCTPQTPAAPPAQRK